MRKLLFLPVIFVFSSAIYANTARACEGACIWMPAENDVNKPSAGGDLIGGHDPCDGAYNKTVLRDPDGSVRCKNIDTGDYSIFSGMCSHFESAKKQCTDPKQFKHPDCTDPSRKGHSFTLYYRQMRNHGAGWNGVNVELEAGEKATVDGNKFTCGTDDPPPDKCKDDPTLAECKKPDIGPVPGFVGPGIGTITDAGGTLDHVDKNHETGGKDINGAANLSQAAATDGGMISALNKKNGADGTNPWAPAKKAGSGGSRSGFGASGGGGLSGNLFGGDAKLMGDDPLADDASGTSLAATGDGIDSTYGAGGGAGAKGGGSGADSSSVGGSGANNMSFGRDPASKVNPMGSEDPANYFARIGLDESIFKRVETRYRETTGQWARLDLSKDRLPASKKAANAAKDPTELLRSSIK